MAPPSQLSIATSSLHRLVNEKASYHREQEMQQKRIDRLEQRVGQAGDRDRDDNEKWGDNDEFVLKQEKRALEETKSVFPGLENSIRAAVANLERLLASAQGGDADAVADADVARAREVLEFAKAGTD